MRARAATCSALALAALVCGPARPAPASPCSTADPGATVDQYCETLPTASGPAAAPDDPNKASAPAAGRPIPPRTVRRLRQTPLGRVLVRDGASPESRASAQPEAVAAPADSRGSSPGAPSRGDARTHAGPGHRPAGERSARSRTRRSEAVAAFAPGDVVDGLPASMRIAFAALATAAALVGLAALLRRRTG